MRGCKRSTERSRKRCNKKMEPDTNKTRTGDNKKGGEEEEEHLKKGPDTN
jgi:hypothetical protein